MRRGRVSSDEWIETEKKYEAKNHGRWSLRYALRALVVRGGQQTEAKVPPSPVRGEISLSNSEQQPLPNQDKYKFRTQLTHDLSRVAVRVTRRQDLKGCQAR